MYKQLMVVVLAACNTQPQSVADCPDLSGAQRDECYAQFAADLFRQDPVRAEEVVNTQVEDQQVRDYIWLTVTREVDPSSYKFCDRIVEPTLGERCRVLVSRPHLHRELQREGAGSQGGGPPPPSGGGGPQGAPPPGAPSQGAPSQGAPSQPAPPAAPAGG